MTQQPTPLLNLIALSADEMKSFVQGLGWPRYRTNQILRWLYQHRVLDIEAMTNLSKADRARLQEVATIHRMLSSPQKIATDGTGKFVWNLEDGLAVETVLIPEGHRRTLCLSSQVGCTLDCGFCLTAEMGLKRSLRAHEIVGQVLNVQTSLPEREHLTSLVFMGMGEPLVNFEPLAEAIQRLTNIEWGLGFSPRRITVSTAGWIPRFPDIRRLGVNLAISLNATTNEQRARLMPAVNGRYDLSALLEACRHYTQFSERPLTFEYVLLAGVNDSPEDAKRLVSLLSRIRCKVNLIPFNEFPGNPFRRPAPDVIETFQGIVRNKGLDVFLRKSRGDDVLGACGQLGRSASEVLSQTTTNKRRTLPIYAQS
ncbi:MAG: 23S rRNA (adenine(2503)-C(2))-methyltransferase RlmN [Nitrospirota bacterium]|nr:23S rRNA (adenine(2503)-C(2))-methyltransferase RlmN [Nitrospirota bacterium]MDH5575394.1 23S rRNA (adenine(2503)-C(2))-methyltransferase RlmN [Nitrospirota bacterium]